MLKRIMMIPISLAAAGGLPFLALNRDLATRFEAALDELTVPSQEEAESEIVEIPSPFGSDSPFRLASAANDGTGTGSGTTRSNSSSSGTYGSGSSSSGTGGSSTSRYGSGTSGSGTGGSGTGGTSTYGSSTSGGSRTSGTSGSGTSGSGTSGSGTSGSGTSGSAGSTGSGSGSTSGSSGVGGTRTSNGVTTYGSGAAAATGGTSSGSGAAGSTGAAGRSSSGSTSGGGGTTGSSTAGTGFSAPPLSAGQELRNPTPGLGLGLGEGRGGGDWPTTPVLGNDYREVFRFDVTPNWVKANWPRVSTGWTEDQLEGYRVPLVTGTRVNDLTGSLTFFFDAEHRVQRLRFVGNTGDASRLVELVTRYFDMELEPTRLAGLYTRRYHGKPVSVLRIAHDSVLRADRPNLQLSIVLEINNPRGTYKLSDAVGELLATDPPISSR